MAEQQQRNERRTGGLNCPTCRLVQTHDWAFALSAFGKVAGLGRKGKTNHEVYKGICLICHSLMQAKLMLNEPLDSIGGGMTIVQRPNGPLGLCVGASNCNANAANQDEENHADENSNEEDSYVSDAPTRQTEISDITMDQNEMAIISGLQGDNFERNCRDILEDIFEEDVQESGNNSVNRVLQENISRQPSSSESHAHVRTRSNECLDRNRQSKDQNTHVRSRSDISHSIPGAHKIHRDETTYYTIFDRKKSGAHDEEISQDIVRRQQSLPVNQTHARNLSNKSVDQTPPVRSMSAPVPGAHQVKDEKEYTTIFDRKMSENGGHDQTMSSGGADQSSRHDGQIQANSSTITTTPGAHTVNGDDEYYTIYDRKKSGDCRSSMNQESNEIMSVSDCTSRRELLKALQNPNSANTVLGALDKFNELKPDQQMDGEWVHALLKIIPHHKTNASVQSQVFGTICSIISDNEHCILDMTFDGPQACDIVHVMEMHMMDESVQEHLCSAVAGVTVIQQHAMCFLDIGNGKIIQLLMDALHCPSREDRVQENALKALFHLISASLTADNHLDEVVRSYLQNGSLIDSMVTCICKRPKSSLIQDEVCDILSKVITPYDEESTCESLRGLFMIITTPEITSNRIVDSRSVAVEAMRRFQSSPGVHEIACRVLASTYAKASTEENICQDFIVAEDLELINSSLSVHIHHSANAASACTALHNFCALLSLSASSDVLGLVRSVTEVINVIENYRGNQQLLEAAVGALHALCSIRDELVIPFESDGTITSIVSAMNRFPNSVSLHRLGIGILWMYLSVSSTGLKFINNDLLTAIVRSMTKDNEESDCETATNIMLALSNKGHQVEQIFFRNHHLIESVVECQFRWPSSVSIQGAAASILSNVALSQSTRKEICHMGGTSRVIAALKILNHNPLLVCKALDSLANLLSGADVEILRSDDLPAPEILVCAMKRYPQNICIQVKGANALRSILSKGELFKDEIVNLGGAEVIAEAMAEFLGSMQMLTKGSVALWALAGSSKTSKDERRKTRIGKCAIEPVVNGLSAHVAQGGISREGISSEETCLAALGCLKCLSTTPANKAVFEATGALELIYSCIWQHYGNPQVCKEALAALCNISVKNITTNEVSEIKSDQLEAVVLAMRTHQFDALATMQTNQAERAVQENAIRLLRNSTFLLTNIVVLRQNPDLSSLVRMAIPYLDYGLRDRVEEDLLHKIQPLEAPVYPGLG